MKVKYVDELNLDQCAKGEVHRLRLRMIDNALGDAITIPVVLMRGNGDGPVLGVTAVLHGNELNGIPVIHNLMEEINVKNLNGTVIAVPVLNSPGYLSGMREFEDGTDLNRIMPGKAMGPSSAIYAHQIVEKIGKYIDYHIDLHTASFGRINSLYVRADLQDSTVARMAKLQWPQIIVNVEGSEGTLREALTDLGSKAITVEVGDPYVFQKKHINPSYIGILNVLRDLGMIEGEKSPIDNNPNFM